jgi:6-methylsalicylate decarboxylase
VPLNGTFRGVGTGPVDDQRMTDSTATSPATRDATDRIDLHHHYFQQFGDAPASDVTAAVAAVARSTGWRMPAENVPWSPEKSIAAMDRLGVRRAVLSVPQGGNEADADNRRAVRLLNDTAHAAVVRHPERFAFFASVPVPLDPRAAIDEIARGLDELGAVGVTLTTSYGEGEDAHYLGSDVFDPVWEELDRRGAVVFVHGDQTPNRNRWPNRFLPLPVTEVPNETYKAAADLVTTGKKRALANTRIVLSHSGGSTPFLAARVAGLSRYLGTALSETELIDDFRSFYYETALSGFETNLAVLESFVPADHILFGTDFPAVPVETAAWYTANVADFYAARPERHRAVTRDNAVALLPALA